MPKLGAFALYLNSMYLLATLCDSSHRLLLLFDSLESRCFGWQSLYANAVLVTLVYTGHLYIQVADQVPGHSSFEKGMPQLTIAACGGVLDPTQNATYDFLRSFLQEMGSVSV